MRLLTRGSAWLERTTQGSKDEFTYPSTLLEARALCACACGSAACTAHDG